MNREFHFVEWVNSLIWLINQSNAEVHDALHYHHRFEDDKVVITGVFKAHETRFNNISVELKMPEDKSLSLDARQKRAIGFMSTTEDSSSNRAYVYELKFENNENWIVVWNRPGHWIDYIKNIVRERRKLVDEIMSFNNQPIDDSELFPIKIPTESPSKQT